MKLFIISIALMVTGVAFSQDKADTTKQVADSTVKVVESIPPKDWQLTALYGVNGTQSSFVNWTAGGRNNITLLGYVSASANYNKDGLKWESDLDFSLGGLQYIGKNNGNEAMQKTDDKIDISSTIGHNFKNHEKIYVSAVGSFNTQTLDGFAYPDDTTLVSGFMAPAYVNLSLGMDYTPNKKFSVFVSPLSAKWTIVNIDTLANVGAYGVKPAEYATNGTLVTAGQHVRAEFGAYFKLAYTKEVIKNIEMKSTLELFSNYLNNPQNIDVNGDVLFTFKVNDWFSASLNWTLIYDHDINIRTYDGGFGPRLQFKSVLGLGISYTMKNFVEETKEK